SVDGLNSYLVSKTARQAVTVALSGVGGDELFVGYPHVSNIARAAALCARWPLARRLPQVRLGPLRRRWPWLDALNMAGLPLPRQYERARQLFPPDLRHALLAADARRAPSQPAESQEPFMDIEELDPSPEKTTVGTLVNQVSRIELRHYMTPVLLRDMDAVSMAHALEVRPPFLDHKLVEFVCRLPGHLKIGGHLAKPLLAGSVTDLVPPAILRRKKAFFHLPMVAWMQHELRDHIEDATNPEAVRRRGVFAPEAVARVRNEFVQNPARAWTGLWMLTVIEYWMRKHLDRAA
ncbi:MAG: hypothetical protein FJ388_08145, partial [Verrucomicrobia bacterium]|nr:hypothetical protein [Verrucomicrobiota bacterium]